MDPDTDPSPALADDPVELLRTLVRFDTTNPPGDERECIEWADRLLSAADFETETYAADPDRPNLVGRLDGGDGPPLLMYGHVDVVPAEGQDWTHPPFDGVVSDGFVWGRGTLDMKGGVAMFLAAALRAARGDVDLSGDLVVLLLSDEEGGGDDGAAFMADEHPEVFADVDHAIGEFGGFSMEISGERFYPIQLDEKAVCWSELTFTGQAGHGANVHSGTAMADMARAITAVDESRLPIQVVPTTERMIERMADELGGEDAETLRGLLDPERARSILEGAGDEFALLDPILHNTANPTVADSDGKVNVIPGETTLTLDCRLLPGQTDDDLERQLRAVIPDDVAFEFEPIRYEPVPDAAEPDLFDLLADILETADPEGTAIPYLLSGGTDARHLARAGVQSYGFLPMQLPPDFDFMSVVHAADERVPVEAIEFGTDRLTELLARYPGDAVGE